MCIHLHQLIHSETLGKLAVEADGEIDYILPQDILYMYRDEKVTKIIT